jgi:hypothetical protein
MTHIVHTRAHLLRRLRAWFPWLRQDRPRARRKPELLPKGDA